MGVATAIALAGAGLAYYMYIKRPQVATDFADKAPAAYTTLLNKYYVDELYDATVVEPCKRLGSLWDWMDRHIIDACVRSIGRMTDSGSAGITWIEKHVIYGGLNVIGYANHLVAWSWRKLQSGMVHHYVAVIVIGLVLLVHILLIWATGSSTGEFAMR
jgi:NADH-quinone oxidoreductase subunit L